MNSADVLQRFDTLPFTLELEVGSLVMTIGEILELQEGTVLRTDHPQGSPFKLRAGGAEFAAAELVVVENSFSARIKNLVNSAKPAGGNGTN